MNKFTKIIAAALVLCMAAGMLPVVTAADGGNSPERGAGTVIAVLAAGFNTNNPLFTLSDGVSGRLSPSDITKFLADSISNGPKIAPRATVKSAGVYRSDKIPYVYDYAECDADVSGSSRGGYLAGVAAANMNGGNTGFNAAAANAQLLLMKIYGMNDEDAFALDVTATAKAITDAVNLGADAIILGTAADIDGEAALAASDAFVKACAYAAEREVPVFAGAGDGDMRGAGSLYWYSYSLADPTAAMPDCGSATVLADVDGVVTVGSVDSAYAGLFAFDWNGENVAYSDSNGEYTATSGMTFAQYMMYKYYSASGVFEFAAVGGVGTVEDFAAVDVKGKIVVVLRGEIAFTEKIANARASGAIAVVVCNNDATTDNAVRMNIEGAALPAVIIGTDAGSRMLEAGSGMLSIEVSEDAPVMSAGSAWGVRGDLSPAVDLSAAGGFIRTTALMSDKTDVNTAYVDGTVYAAATAAAEFCAAKASCGLDGDAVMALLKASAATALDYNGNEASPNYQGAGAVSASRLSTVAASAAVYDTAGNAIVQTRAAKNGSLTFRVVLSLENYGAKRVFDMYATVLTLAVQTYTREELLEGYGEFYESTGYEYDEMFGLDLTAALPGFVDGTTAPLGFVSVKTGDYAANLNAAADNFSPVRVTVAEKSAKTVTLTFRVAAHDIGEYFDAYENGAFIFGYVTLAAADGGSDISVPYSFFFGDWADAPLLGGFNFDGGAQFYDYNTVQTYTANDHYSDFVTVGINNYFGDEHFSTADGGMFSLSPEGLFRGELYLKLYPLRDIDSTLVRIFDAAGALLYEYDAGPLPAAAPASDGSVTAGYVNVWSCRDADNYFINMPDGEYYAEITFASDFGDAAGGVRKQTVAFGFNIDTEKPSLESWTVRETDGGRFLDVTVSDNFAVQYLLVSDALGESYKSETAMSDTLSPVSAAAARAESEDGSHTVSFTFDITKLKLSTLYLELGDYACNEVRLRLAVGD